MRKVLATLSTAGVAIVICLGAWLLFAPAKLGGSTRYAVVEGASMQPALQRGLGQPHAAYPGFSIATPPSVFAFSTG